MAHGDAIGVVWATHDKDTYTGLRYKQGTALLLFCVTPGPDIRLSQVLAMSFPPIWAAHSHWDTIS